MTFVSDQVINRPVEEIVAFLHDPRNLSRVMPPFPRIILMPGTPEKIEKGAEIPVIVDALFFRIPLITRIENVEEDGAFTDCFQAPLIRRWSHTHRCTSENGRTRLVDEITIDASPAVRLVLPMMLSALFAWRTRMMQRLFP